MHNTIMAAGSRNHPPMLATRRYLQWRSQFLRYIDTRPNGDALRKCILNGPYIPTTVVVQAVAATDDSPVVLEHTTKYEKLSKGYNKMNSSTFKMSRQTYFGNSNDQNDVESDDEHVALANLIANLKLNVDENKKIQKQLKKANTGTCSGIKRTEFEKYKAFNDRTFDYDKLELVKEKYDELIKQSFNKVTLRRSCKAENKDMQKRRNDVKARTTLLLALPDEHQLRFSKYKTAKELWEAILKTFGGNKATKKTKKNQLKLGKDEVHTASVPIASIQVSTTSTDVLAASLSHDTIYIEEIDIKWNMALLSMRADRFWKKTGKKITIQGSDVAGFEKSKVEYFNCHKMGHFTRECRAPRSQDRGKRESYKQ
nr:ribonuclease H-like domain-containing protein [Tanacetum cinerariifolium]